MESNTTVPTQDLRSGSVESHRERNSKQKWALGADFGCSRREADGNMRPYRPSRNYATLERRRDEKVHHKDRVARRKPVAFDDSQDYYLPSDSSADETASEASAAPDAGITYSFDAQHGPSAGSQILSTALTHAVEQFENKVTAKLVKDEYDVLDGAEMHAEDHQQRSSPATYSGPSHMEEDYEFV